MNNVYLLIIGLFAGILGGLFGIGGGLIIVPCLIFLLHYTQQQAQGTSLAILVLPIGILAAWTYYQKGMVSLAAVGLVAVGFFFGGLLGAKVAVGLPNDVLKKMFGVFLMLVAVKMIAGK